MPRWLGAIRLLHLQPDDRREPAVAQLRFDHLHQIVGLLLAALGIGVAGDPEQLDRGDLHAREQVGEAVRHHVFQQHEVVVGADPQEARHAAAHRHLHPRHGELAFMREAQRHQQVERQVGDERERMRRIHRQRRYQREDVLVIVCPDRGLLFLGQFGERSDADLLSAQITDQRLEDLALLAAELRHDDPALVQLLARRTTVDTELVHAGADLLLQAADPLHEELVHVGGGDRQELDPFKQRRATVARLVQDAEVELQPGQLAVEIQLRRYAD